MLSIEKSCADSLRFFFQENHQIELKATHAHELVAAYFGYQSRAALLAETKYPLSNLSEAETVIFPPHDVLEIRIKGLLGESPALPDVPSISKRLLEVLVAEKAISGRVFSCFEQIATLTAEEHLNRRWNKLGINLSSVKLDLDMDVEWGSDNVLLTVFRSYQAFGQNPERLRDSKISIEIPRVAAKLGFGKPMSYETTYTAGARKMNFPDDIVWPSQRH
jgi:hypothetical protein